MSILSKAGEQAQLNEEGLIADENCHEGNSRYEKEAMKTAKIEKVLAM